MGFLERACRQALERVRRGYYNITAVNVGSRKCFSAALRGDIALICEIKTRSPSSGVLRPVDDVVGLASEMARAGADAISVLTDPDNFSGSIRHLVEISRVVDRPTLMKDFVVSRDQVEAASRAGASAILLIYRAFERGLTEIGLREAIECAHALGLEVLLEVHGEEELGKAGYYDFDFIGVNSRDLDTLSVDLARAERAIRNSGVDPSRIILESGIRDRRDIECFLEIGVNKFLVGTAVMTSRDPSKKIMELKGVWARDQS